MSIWAIEYYSERDKKWYVMVDDGNIVFIYDNIGITKKLVNILNNSDLGIKYRACEYTSTSKNSN